MSPPSEAASCAPSPRAGPRARRRAATGATRWRCSTPALGQRADDEGAARPSCAASASRTAGLFANSRLEQARRDPVRRPARRQRGGEPLAVGAEDGARLAEQLGERCRARSCSERPSSTRSLSRSSTAVARRSALSWRCAASSCDAQLDARLRVRDRDGGEVREERARARRRRSRERVRAVHVVEEDHADDLAAEDHRHRHDRADLPEADRRLDHARVRGARWRRSPAAASRSSSRVTPSAGHAGERALDVSSSDRRAVAAPTQPRNRSPASSRRWMLQRSTPTSVADLARDHVQQVVDR